MFAKAFTRRHLLKLTGIAAAAAAIYTKTHNGSW
jgi:hypothetical protein